MSLVLLHVGMDWFSMSFSLLWYTPIHRKFLSVTELETPQGRFLVFSLGIGCTMWLNWSLFFESLCWVQKYVFPLVSYWSNFILAYHFPPSFFLYASICFTSAYTREFLLSSRLYTQVFYKHLRMPLFWIWFGWFKVVGWILNATESSWVLLVSVYYLCFWLETSFICFFN